MTCVLWEESTLTTTAKTCGYHDTVDHSAGQAYYDPGDDIDACQLSFAMSLGAGDISAKTYNAEIWTTTGTGGSIALDVLQGTSQGVTGDNAWNKTWVDFTFSTPVSLANGTRYALIVHPVVADLSNYAYLYYGNTDVLEGFAATFVSTGSRYYYNSLGYDAAIKIYEESLGPSTGLQDMSLDIQAYFQALEDGKLDLSAYQDVTEDGKLDLSAYQDVIEDGKFDLSAYQDITEDGKLDIAAYFQALEDGKLDLSAYHDFQEDLIFDVEVAGWARADLDLDLSAAAQVRQDLPMGLVIAAQDTDDNAVLDLDITDGIDLHDMGMDLEITDGIDLHDMGMDLAAVSVAPVFRAVYAMHLDSTITEV